MSTTWKRTTWRDSFRLYCIKGWEDIQADPLYYTLVAVSGFAAAWYLLP